MGRIAKHKLILGACIIGRNVCAALAIFLQTPKSNLAELVFDNAFINDEGTAVLAMGIVGNSTLKDLMCFFLMGSLGISGSLNLDGGLYLPLCIAQVVSWREKI